MNLHCWHETGVSKLINPPSIEEKCCWCGLQRWRIESPKGHGPFFPKKNVLPGKYDETRPHEYEECPQRECK